MDIFNRSEDEILFELIKKDNPDAGIARNTKLTLNAIKGQGFRGNVTVWYNR